MAMPTLAHPAGQLVWVVLEAGPGLGNADQLEQLLGPGVAALSSIGVDLERLADLVADGEHRVERGQRILEDEPDAAARSWQRVDVDVEQVLALEHRGAADDLTGRHRDQRSDIIVTDLPEPLADDTQELAPFSENDTPLTACTEASWVENALQIGDFEDRAGRPP